MSYGRLVMLNAMCIALTGAALVAAPVLADGPARPGRPLVGAIQRVLEAFR